MQPSRFQGYLLLVACWLLRTGPASPQLQPVQIVIMLNAAEKEDQSSVLTEILL